MPPTVHWVAQENPQAAKDVEVAISLVHEWSDRFSRYGQWRVMSVSWQLTYFGSNNQFGLAPTCICEGTTLTLGCDRDRRVTYAEENVADSGASGTSGDPKLETTGGDSNNTLGLILIDAPIRRHF